MAEAAVEEQPRRRRRRASVAARHIDATRRKEEEEEEVALPFAIQLHSLRQSADAPFSFRTPIRIISNALEHSVLQTSVAVTGHFTETVHCSHSVQSCCSDVSDAECVCVGVGRCMR